MASKASAISVLILCSAVVACSAAGGRAGVGGGTIFNVLTFGAKPNSRVDSTQAFVDAWHAACGFNGDARLVIPPGIFKLSETIFQGPCKSRTPITVLLQGTLQAVSDISAFPDKGWISFDNVDGVVLTGGGTIDGQGQNVWEYNDCKTNPGCTHLPASLYIVKSQNVQINGINLINSMGFHMHITRSFNVRLHGLKITAPADSPNTDGMHVSSSNTVRIARSVIRTGDDCVSLGQGANNVTVNKVFCGPGHGISIGSLGKLPNELDVTGLIVKNCTLSGTTNGIRIKTYPGSTPSKATGFLFNDIVMDNVQNPIIIDQNYGSNSNKPSLVKISDVFFHNIRGTSASQVAVSLMCSSGVPCQNIRLHNINLQLTGKGVLSGECANAKVQKIGLQLPLAC